MLNQLDKQTKQNLSHIFKHSVDPSPPKQESQNKYNAEM